MAGFDVPFTEMLKFFKFPTLIFCSSLENVESKFLERKVGVTKRPRSRNPGKAVAMAICPIVHFDNLACTLKHDVACEFAHTVTMHRSN